MNNDEYIGIIEHETAGVLHVVRHGGLLIAGTACNVGMIEQYSYEIDQDFSLGENLQDFIEHIV